MADTCGSQAFIATLLFGALNSALPVIAKQNSVRIRQWRANVPPSMRLYVREGRTLSMLQKLETRCLPCSDDPSKSSGKYLCFFRTTLRSSEQPLSHLYPISDVLCVVSPGNTYFRLHSSQFLSVAILSCSIYRLPPQTVV